MKNFTLDKRLQADCHVLFESDATSYLLHKNAEVLWLIMVPHTEQTEFYELEVALQEELCRQINRLSAFLQSHFSIDKINLATIGNVVAQMHIHVIGRRHDDAYWPDVVWGQSFDKTYSPAEVESLRQQLQDCLSQSAA